MKRNILIVDDSTSIRQVIRRYLSAVSDIEILEAGNGAEAETVVQESVAMGNPIHIMFLDWMMPEMTGFELLKRIRQVAAFEKLPVVIMLTAETYPDQVEAVLDFKVSAYLMKPFSEQDIVDAVTRALGSEVLKDAV